ncbi:MAG: septal ring lytic transglycosylase RlpA family protein [Methylobacter sp.]|nr:septal ring lytic transglycosylase RlpA family protein [Methylobacter sp.]
MNKTLPILLIFVLCSCTTEQIKTTDSLSQPPVTTNSTVKHPFRYLSKLHFGDLDTQNTAAEEENLLPRIARYFKQGIASWYGSDFHGKKTANGEIYDMYAMTAAHKTLPMSSYVRVTNLENQRSVIVRINDRGPYHGDRVMDLSYAAAKKLDLHEAGLGAVEIKAIAPEQALAQLQKSAETQEKDIYLQVGTFGNKKKAMKLQNKIAAHQLPQPEILPSTHKGSTLYKVQMGPIKSPESGHKLNIQLAKLGITTTQFVTDPYQTQDAMIQ